SGTSGFTKGAILSVKNIFSNIIYGREKIPLEKESNIVSFLPLAHVFGLMFDFLYPITFGCHITFLSKMPSPNIIVKAFKEVKPRLILSVPLVIEKIYFKQIYPKLHKPFMKLLMHIPVFSSLVKKHIRKKLIKLFGGNCKQVILGGAAFNKEVESFFSSIKFPLTVGYGMTECAPLIGYIHWEKRKKLSSGQLVDRMKIRIDSPDPYNKAGEIQVKGDNIMLGYYKNQKSTNEAIDKYGWLHTGDLGLIDNEQNIFIKGRCKDMILDSSGQNIYPEVIENSLSKMPFVTECVVIQKDKKLIALVYSESFTKKEISKEETDKNMGKNRNLLNQNLPKYSQINRIELMDREFEKTPKRNIRRFLYT
ncbi:MAG: AMP-binding protein, partial [Prolixibacteraceae bacterium]|nr:AMP-binding protein [Prolixibacteraceae bacterium]